MFPNITINTFGFCTTPGIPSQRKHTRNSFCLPLTPTNHPRSFTGACFNIAPRNLQDTNDQNTGDFTDFTALRTWFRGFVTILLFKSAFVATTTTTTTTTHSNEDAGEVPTYARERSILLSGALSFKE